MLNFLRRTDTPTTATTQTAGTTATSTTPPPALTLSDIGDLLRHADSENCDYAASALAGPCADFHAGTLLDLLSNLPAEVPLRVLLDKLADALVRRNVANPAVWNDLLHLIKSNPKPGPNERQLERVAHFAECLASLRVTDLNVWGKLTASLPPSDSTRYRAHCGAMIARALAHAGVEAPVVWDALLASLVDVHAGDKNNTYTAVATSLERGAVSDTAAWKALWRNFEASGPGFRDVKAVQHMFTRCFKDCPDEMAHMVSLLEQLKLSDPTDRRDNAAFADRRAAEPRSDSWAAMQPNLVSDKVADDLVRRNVVNPAVWIDLLHRIKANPNPGASEQQLAQIDHCARCLESLQVTDLAVWSEVATSPTFDNYSMRYGEKIAGSMARAGVKAPAVWDTLIASMVGAHAGSLAAYASVATCLEGGVAVSDTAAWKALWRNFEASGPSLGQVMAMQSFAKCFSECPDELTRMESLFDRTPNTITFPASSGPSIRQIADLLRVANSNEHCSEAAALLAGACADLEPGVLRELLSGLPAEVPMPYLCWQLTDALVAREVTSPAIWSDVLHVIKSAPPLAGYQLKLLDQCARCIAALKVTDITVWSDVVALPPDQPPNSLLHWARYIAGSMARAGMEEPVLWDTLIGAMVQARAGSQSAHLEVAQYLEQGLASVGVPALTALWRHFEAGEHQSQDEKARLFELIIRLAPMPI